MPDFEKVQQLANQIKAAPVEPTINNLYPTLSSADLSTGGRYPVYHLGLDNEDIYGRNQSGTTQLLNGVTKGLTTAGTTFIGGTVGLVNGVFQWANDGKFSSFYDNSMTRKLDEFSQSMENSRPNYQTQQEADAKWYSTDTWLTANFWGDTILKNAGFAVGAIASGYAWGKVGSMVSNVSKGLSTGAGVELGTNSALEASLLTREAGAIENLSSQSSNLANRFASFEKIKDMGSNAVRSGLATFGEASMESLQAKNQYKDFLTKEYRDKFGKDPEGDEALKIDQEADKVGNVTMAANTALLTATNYIQFPKVMGTMWRAERNALANGVGNITLRNAEGQAIQTGSEAAFKQGVQYGTVPVSTLTKVVKGINRATGTVFAGSEAFEEGAQYVIPIAAQDYFNKGRQGKAQDLTESTWKGVKELFNSKEGMISLLSGGITGGLMRSLSPFSQDNIVKRFKNRGMEAARTNDFVDRLNGTMMGSGYMNQAIQSLNRAELISQEAEQALRNNNRLQYEDSRTDQILNYMLPRIQYGRHDLIQDDLMGMRNVATSQEGYSELIKNGYVGEDVDRVDFINNVDRLMVMADNTNSYYKSLHERYGSIVETDESGRKYKKYNEDVLGKMAYVGAKINDYNARIPQLIRVFNNTDIDIATLMSQVHTGGIGTEDGVSNEDFNALLDQIEALRGVSPELKDEMKENAADLIELSARREFKIREYEQMRNNPQEWEDEARKFSVVEDGKPDMSKVNFNEVEEEAIPGDYEALYQIVFDQTEGKDLTEEMSKLRDQYPKLYEQLTATVDQSWENVRRRRALEEGWFQNSQGEPMEPTSKSDFFQANTGNYTMSVNGVQREGTLGYDPDTNSLFFQYEDNGDPKQVEVFNEDFNEGLITRDSGTIDTGYLSEEDTAAPNRIQVRLSNLIDEVSARQTQIDSDIQIQLNELLTITETIKSEEKDAREFTKDYVETMSTLRDMQLEVEASYTALIQEREQLNNVRAELEVLLQVTPSTLTSSIDLMERQRTDLESLAAHNGKLIPALQDLANSATEMLNRLGKKIISRITSMVGIPQSPDMNRVREAFNRWDQSGSTEDLNNAVTALTQEYERIQNFEVKPLLETDVKWINEKVAQAQESIKNIDQRVKAKAIVIERLQDLNKQVREREEIVRETPPESVADVKESLPSEANTQANLDDLDKTKAEFEDTRVKELEYEGKTQQEAQEQAKTEWDNSQEGKRRGELITTVNTPELFGEDSERTPISRYFSATVLLPKSMRNKGYDRRMNIFLNKIGIFDRDRRPNLRLVAVTRDNEASLGLAGFIDQYFQVRDSFDKASDVTVGQGNSIDAPIGMVLTEVVDGNIIFIDEAGNRIPEGTQDLVNKVLLTKMKAASLTWSTGETAYSDPTGLGQNFANAKREEFEEQRKAILASNAPQLFTFRTSQGRQRESSATESPDIVGNIITEEVMKQKAPVLEVIRPDEGKTSKVVPGIMEGETVQVKAGTILLRTQDTLQKVYTRKLSQNEREKVKSALMYLVENRESPTETLYKVRAYLEGSTFLKFGRNLETLTIGPAKFNLTEDNVKGKSFQQVASTLGLENILGKQNTNVREGLIKNNKAFSEFTGIEDGQPTFKYWNTYQEYILSTEGGRNPLVYAPIMVDKYLVFSPEKTRAEAVIKPVSSPEVIADRQVRVTQKNTNSDVIKNQSDLIKTITNYFTRANQEGLTEEQKTQEKEKANAAAAVILRMATVMVERGKYESVADVYKALNFTNLLSKLNKGALFQTEKIEKTLYFLKPSKSGIFSPGGEVTSSNDGVYQLNVKAGNPNEAEVIFISSEENIQVGLSSSSSWLSPAIESDNSVIKGDTYGIRMDQPGVAVFKNGNWEIIKKAKVTYLSKSSPIPAPFSKSTNEEKAEILSSKIGLNVSEENVAPAVTTAKKIESGEEVIFKTPQAKVQVQDNVLINTESQSDGSLKVVGVLDPNTAEWQGQPKEIYNEVISIEDVPESAKGAISMIEGGQAIIYAATGTADISTVLHEVAHFYEANALTDDEKSILQSEANESLGKEATPTEVSEFLARGFERYLRDETLPDGKNVTQTIEVKGQDSKLNDIFKKIRQFMVEIYDTVFGSDIDIKLSLPMKQIYQDMLGIGFAERETRRKNLNKDAFPKSLVGESFAPTLETREFTKGRNYKILGANSGSVTSMTVKSGDIVISVPKGQVAVRDSITKEIKVVDIASVISQLEDPVTEKVVRKERQARKDKVSKVVQTPEEDVELTGEIIEAPLPPSEIVAIGPPIPDRPLNTVTEVVRLPEVPKKATKVKAPTATVEGLKTFAGPEDTEGGIFLKEGEPVYILPYFDNYVQVEQDVYKAYKKASTPSRGRTEITNSRKLGKVKVGSTVTLSQNIGGVEQEVTYEVTNRAASSVTVKNNRDSQIFEVENVSMKTGADAAREAQIKAAFLNKYVGETFTDINKFLDPNPTTIQDKTLPNLNIKC